MAPSSTTTSQSGHTARAASGSTASNSAANRQRQKGKNGKQCTNASESQQQSSRRKHGLESSDNDNDNEDNSNDNGHDNEANGNKADGDTSSPADSTMAKKLSAKELERRRKEEGFTSVKWLNPDGTPKTTEEIRVNPHTNDAWFGLLEETIEQHDIVEETTYGLDEFGCDGATGQQKQEIGKVKGTPQYQQVGGSCENITVIVAICGDGTPTPPVVIFKGSAYQVSWKQDNPANTSLGYSKKGWMNGEIGMEWLKGFDTFTKAKAAGQY
ncbi:hypothetical protein BOTBODRAFT_172508 [Botryobasidium botryosum FD-172 SS1]|uniref:DDE-1 domain-containing protein n=1 Tax=Botryobasidium botryosum (strain FD-172 SS1) TaxID=930990 RepID=A0A067MYE5_BOTB1|nr:hypothetical protein BOTBODRAFT_172508 [Botryobasidium botryosum FD-172 SS1]